MKLSKFVMTALTSCLAVGNFALQAVAYPGNTLPFDCYRKADNRFVGGSRNSASNRNNICVPNPDLNSTNRVRRTTPSPTVRSGRRPPYSPYRYRRRGPSFGAGVGVGIGGALLLDSISRSGRGWGGGNVVIDDSINVIGDEGEWNDWGDDIDSDFGGGGDMDFGDDFGDDFGGDFGGDDFGGDFDF